MGAAHNARSDALTIAKASGDTYILMIANLSLAETLRQQGKLQMEYMACARVLIARGRLDEAVELLQRLRDAAKAGERRSRVIEIMILQTLAFQARNETERAITMLKKALNLAESEGFFRIFVDEGPPMARLL